MSDIYEFNLASANFHLAFAPVLALGNAYAELRAAGLLHVKEQFVATVALGNVCYVEAFKPV